MLKFTLHLILPDLIQKQANAIMLEWRRLPEQFAECIGIGEEFQLDIHLTFLTIEQMMTVQNIPEWFSQHYPADKNENTFFIMVDFKKIGNNHLPLEHSIDGSNYLAFPIWDLTEEIVEDAKNINIAMEREFYTYLTSYRLGTEHIEYLNTHDGNCIRTYTEPTLSDNLKPLERIKLLTAARYNNVSLNLCKYCSNKLCESFLNFLSKTSETAELVANIKQRKKDIEISQKISDSATSRGMEKATARTLSTEKITTRTTIPEKKTKSSTKKISEKNGLLKNNDQEDDLPSFIRYNLDSGATGGGSALQRKRKLTPEQESRIASIMLSLNIKEPISDEFYIEIRERFLEGKISEHVFKQQAKRLAR